MVLVRCPLQKKVESKVWRRYYWTFADKRSCWLVRKCRKSFCRIKRNKRYSSKRRKWWSTRSSLKEIVNFVFNKSTQETRRIRLSRLFLYKKETPRRRINPKNWLLNELWHKIPNKGILSLTKVKLSVDGWRHGFKQVSHCISFCTSSFLFFFWWGGYNIVITWMYFIFVNLFNVFGELRKNTQSRIL